MAAPDDPSVSGRSRVTARKDGLPHLVLATEPAGRAQWPT